MNPDRVRQLLHTHVLEVWFPRCFDPAGPGLFAEFGPDWSPRHGRPRLLEFSVRQGWAATVLAAQFPQHAEILHEAVRRARHDIDHVFHDPHSGGWRQWSNPIEGPQQGSEVHLHGLAYMISFESTRALLFPQDGALERSLACWHWVKQAVGDTLQIGLRVPLTSADPVEAWHRLDGVGTPYALCDLNVLGDCFEALVLLHQAWPESDLLSQLEALRDQLLSLVHRATGTVQFFFNSVGEVGPGHHWRIGQTWQLVKRILQAEVVLPITPKIIETLKLIVLNTIERAWDPMSGGFFFALPHCLPDSIEGHDLVVRRKSWWVQFEALAALDVVAASPHFDKALSLDAIQYANQTLEFIEHYLLDQQYGGFFDHAADASEQRTALFKGGAWKDGSHETLCLSQLLQRAEQSPLLRRKT